MQRPGLSASFAVALVAALLAAPAATAQSQLNVKSVGEFFVDAKGRASGQNLATSIAEADGLIEGFSSLALGADIFSSIRVNGFTQAEKIKGVGSSALTLRGSNALVSLHDNINSVVLIETTSPTTVAYKLAPDVTATQEGPHGAIVRLTHGSQGYLGSLVAYGAAGPGAQGDILRLKGGEIVAHTVAGSKLVFLAKPIYLAAADHEAALVQAAAAGSLASHYVTEFEGSSVRTSQVDYAPHTRTAASGAGSVATTVRSEAEPSRVLAYDLAYETLPARSASDVAVYADGKLATRASSPSEVRAFAQSGIAAFHAIVSNGRTQILASTPDFPAPGEHRIVVSVGAQASTESQAQAEESGNDDARVYGGFEYHSNGKLTGDFLTSVIPEGHAQLLSFTELATRTEIFRSVSVDAGAEATFHAEGADAMRIETSKADLTLMDDVLATLMLRAKAPADATFELASSVTARALRDGVLTLQGPHGPAGALVLLGDGTLTANAQGAIHARLAAGSAILYRGAADAHASEEAVLGALADGLVGAQLLAGTQAGATATKATTFSDDVTASIRPSGAGVFIVDYLARTDDAPRGFVFDARGASIAARSASDIHVTVDGVEAIPVDSPADALDLAGFPRYFASTSLDGALRVIVHTAAATGHAASIHITSTVESAARANTGTDAFGAFRLFHDGSAVGSYVKLKADRAAGAVSGFTMVATGEPIFASLAAGASSFASTGSDGASVLKLENREARLEFADTTNGFAKIVALQDTEAAFRLAAGLRAESRGPEVIEIIDANGEQLASLVIAGGDAAGSLEAHGEREIRANLARGAQAIFRTHAGIESELSDAQRTMINAAIAGGHIAGQVMVQTQADLEADIHELEQTARTESEGVLIAAQSAFGEVTSAVTASYGDVQVLTAATKTRVDITVASAAAVGKTLIVSLDPDTVPGMSTGHAVIKFDGEIVAQASSYSDILDPNDDDGVAEYFVLAGDAGTQVLVSIPHFSVHTVTLEEQPQNSNALYMYATGFLGLLVVVESALLARGHKARNTINTRRP